MDKKPPRDFPDDTIFFVEDIQVNGSQTPYRIFIQLRPGGANGNPTYFTIRDPANEQSYITVLSGRLQDPVLGVEPKTHTGDVAERIGTGSIDAPFVLVSLSIGALPHQS